MTEGLEEDAVSLSLIGSTTGVDGMATAVPVIKKFLEYIMLRSFHQFLSFHSE